VDDYSPPVVMQEWWQYYDITSLMVQFLNIPTTTPGNG
jgi:hypothetical protein